MPDPVPSPAPVLRAASPDDIPVIRRLAHDIWWHCYRGMIPDEQIAFMLDWMYATEVIQESLRTGTHWTIPELEGQPVGFVSWSLCTNTRTVHLHKLYLHPTRHGRGIGQFLLAHVRDSARAAGADRVELRVNRRNQPAIRAYYNLEEIWGGKSVRVKLGATRATPASAAAAREAAPSKPARPRSRAPRPAAA